MIVTSETVLIQLPALELLLRASATALIVILVATAVGRLGPTLGGLVAGLPIGLGPGFYFLLDTAPKEFLVHLAASSLLALCATQFFLLTYTAAAGRTRPTAAIALSVIVWWGVIAVFGSVSTNVALATILFLAATVSTRWIGRRFVLPHAKAPPVEGIRALILRAIVGGLLVAITTILAPHFGPRLSGILLAFPIGYAMISVTIHERFGASTVTNVTYAAILGTLSLATFCVAFALALDAGSASVAFVFALIASVASTGFMTAIARCKSTVKP